MTDPRDVRIAELEAERNTLAYRLQAALTRLGYCEISLGVYEPARVSEYWQRYPERVTAEEVRLVENSCRREAAPTPAPLLDGLSAQAEPSNPSLGVDGAVRESPEHSVVEKPVFLGVDMASGPDRSVGYCAKCAGWFDLPHACE